MYGGVYGGFSVLSIARLAFSVCRRSAGVRMLGRTPCHFAEHAPYRHLSLAFHLNDAARFAALCRADDPVPVPDGIRDDAARLLIKQQHTGATRPAMRCYLPVLGTSLLVGVALLAWQAAPVARAMRGLATE